MDTTTITYPVKYNKTKYTARQPNKNEAVRSVFPKLKFGTTLTDTIVHNTLCEYAAYYVKSLCDAKNKTLLIYGRQEIHGTRTCIPNNGHYAYENDTLQTTEMRCDCLTQCRFKTDAVLLFAPHDDALVKTLMDYYQDVYCFTYNTTNLRGEIADKEGSYDVTGDKVRYQINKYTFVIPKHPIHHLESLSTTYTLPYGGLIVKYSQTSRPTQVVVSEMDGDYVGMTNVPALKASLSHFNSQYTDVSLIRQECLRMPGTTYILLKYGSVFTVRIPQYAILDLKSAALYRPRTPELIRHLTQRCDQLLRDNKLLTPDEQLVVKSLLPIYVYNDVTQTTAQLESIDSQVISNYNNALHSPGSVKSATLLGYTMPWVSWAFVGLLSCLPLAIIAYRSRYLKPLLALPSTTNKPHIYKLLLCSIPIVIFYCAKIKLESCRTVTQRLIHGFNKFKSYVHNNMSNLIRSNVAINGFCVQRDQQYNTYNNFESANKYSCYIQGDVVDCAPKIIAHCVGVGIEGYEPVVPQQCFHNQYHALKHRLLIEPQRPLATIETHAHNLLNLMAIYLPAIEDYEFVEKDQYLKRFKEAKYKSITDAAAHEHIYPTISDYESFTKVEKLCKRGIIDGTSIIGLIKPRFISGVKPARMDQYGYIIYNAQKMLQLTWNPNYCITYASGMTAEDLGVWYGNVLDSFEDPVFFENDYSTFDATEEWPLLEFEMQVYQRLFHYNTTRSTDFDAHRDEILKYWTKGACYTKNNSIAYKHHGKRPSGSPNTSVGNTIINGFCALQAMHTVGLTKFKIIVLGDDNIIVLERAEVEDKGGVATLKLAFDQVSLDLGLKPDHVHRANKHLVEFCSGRFYPTLDGWVWAPKIGRLLAKTGWCTLDIPQSKRNDWMTVVLEGLRFNCANLPLVKSIYANWGKQTPKWTKFTNYIQFPGTEPAIYNLHHEFWYDVYGLSIGEFVELEAELRSKLPFVRNPSDKLCAVMNTDIGEITTPVVASDMPYMDPIEQYVGITGIVHQIKTWLGARNIALFDRASFFHNLPIATSWFTLINSVPWIEGIGPFIAGSIMAFPFGAGNAFTSCAFRLAYRIMPTTNPILMVARNTIVSFILLYTATSMRSDSSFNAIMTIIMLPIIEEIYKRTVVHPSTYGFLEWLGNDLLYATSETILPTIIMLPYRVITHTILGRLPSYIGCILHSCINYFAHKDMSLSSFPLFDYFNNDASLVTHDELESCCLINPIHLIFQTIFNMPNKKTKASKTKTVKKQIKPKKQSKTTIKMIPTRKTTQIKDVIKVCATPSPYFNIKPRDKGSIRVSGNFVVKNVNVPINNLEFDTTLQLFKVDFRPVNQIWNGQKLYTFGTMYDKYAINRLKWHIVPTGNALISGTTMAFYRRDPADPDPEADAQQAFANYPDHVLVRPNKSEVLDVHKFVDDNGKKITFFTDPQGGDERLFDAGTFYFYKNYGGPESAYSVMIWCEFDIDFMNPKVISAPAYCLLQGSGLETNTSTQNLLTNQTAFKIATNMGTKVTTVSGSVEPEQVSVIKPGYYSMDISGIIQDGYWYIPTFQYIRNETNTWQTIAPYLATTSVAAGALASFKYLFYAGAPTSLKVLSGIQGHFTNLVLNLMNLDPNMVNAYSAITNFASLNGFAPSSAPSLIQSLPPSTSSGGQLTKK